MIHQYYSYLRIDIYYYYFFFHIVKPNTSTTVKNINYSDCYLIIGMIFNKFT